MKVDGEALILYMDENFLTKLTTLNLVPISYHDSKWVSGCGSQAQWSCQLFLNEVMSAPPINQDNLLIVGNVTQLNAGSLVLDGLRGMETD